MKKAPNYNKFLKSVNKLLETKNTKKKIKTVKKNTKKHEVAINIERRRKREQEKLAEVQMRKRNFEHWRIIESSEKYQSLIVQNLCDRKSQIIELEVLDGIFLNLSKKYRAKFDVWGNRKLAYPINYETEGYYVLVNYASEPDFPAELDRIVNITQRHAFFR